jgi:hypothetical protein
MILTVDADRIAGYSLWFAMVKRLVIVMHNKEVFLYYENKHMEDRGKHSTQL